MSHDISIATIVGSLRTDSFHRILFENARAIAPSGVGFIEAQLDDVPFFNADLEDAGDPDAVTALKDTVRSADGLIIFTPEYNGSIPAVTKNAVDWLTRPPGSAPVTDKPVGIVAATPGRHGASGVREHLSAVVGSNSNRLFEETHGIASISRRIDGRELQADALVEFGEWLGRFVEFIENAGDDQQSR